MKDRFLLIGNYTNNMRIVDDFDVPQIIESVENGNITVIDMNYGGIYNTKTHEWDKIIEIPTKRRD